MNHMKNIIYKSLLAFMILTAAFSCRDESLVRIPPLESGPNVRLVLQTPSINFFGDLTTAIIEFDTYSESKNLQLVDIRVFLASGGVNSDTVSAVTFTQADFDNKNGVIKGTKLALSDVATAIGVPGGLAGLQGADQLIFLNYTTLTNGATYPSATVTVNGVTHTNLNPAIPAANITTSFTSNFVVSLTCPSTITEGAYTATQNDADVWFGGPGPLPSTNQVTITKVAGTDNQYLISDVTAGGYFACCGGGGFRLNQPAVVTDVCLGIRVTANAGAQINIGQGAAVGSWNPATSTLVVHYNDVSNGSLAAGFDLVTTFVKN
jgi:hypothetical protein